MSSNRVILVTGGAGYIGTSICKSLLDHGYKPIRQDKSICLKLNSFKIKSLIS